METDAGMVTAEHTSLVKASADFFHGSAQNNLTRMPIEAAEQSNGSGASTSLAAFSSCLLCVKRMLVVVLILRLLSRELTMMTSRSSSCILGSDMSSRGTSKAEDVEASDALGRLLPTAGQIAFVCDYWKSNCRAGVPALSAHRSCWHPV